MGNRQDIAAVDWLVAQMWSTLADAPPETADAALADLVAIHLGSHHPAAGREHVLQHHFDSVRKLIPNIACAFRRSRPVVPTDRDHLIQSIATSGAGCGQVPSGALAISGLPFVVKRERGRPRSQQEGPARAAQCPHG
jgi:hypothetical protein